MNRVNVAGTGVGKDGDQNVLFDVEGPWIQSELPPFALEEHSIGDHRRHEVAEWDHGNLCGDGCDGQRFPAVPEELVEEGEECAG